jgi:hypothetical protein
MVAVSAVEVSTALSSSVSKPTQKSRLEERHSLPSKGGKGKGYQGKGKGKGAGAPSNHLVAGQIQQLKEMGFSEQQARQALAECVWDVNKALDLLFTRGDAPLGLSEGVDIDVGNDESTSDAVDESASTSESTSKGAALSPVPSGKARAPCEGMTAGGSSPGGVDSAEQSTTASTASSPRSSGCVDKSEKVASTFVPLSPQSSGNVVAAVVEEEEEEEEAVRSALGEVSVAPISSVEAEIQNSMDESSNSESQVESSQSKRLQLVCRSWETELADGQLSVKEGDFVSVWNSTVTEHGWVYAEDEKDSAKAGWLPGCVLEELQSSQRWMLATQSMEAMHGNETQLSVKEGTLYKVSVDTRTNEGWCYAESSAFSAENACDSGTSQAGWVPVFCLEWIDH